MVGYIPQVDTVMPLSRHTRITLKVAPSQASLYYSDRGCQCKLGQNLTYVKAYV